VCGLRVGAAEVWVVRRRVVARSAVDVGKNILKCVVDGILWNCAGETGPWNYNGCRGQLEVAKGRI
jgi:hypothetical protein